MKRNEQKNATQAVKFLRMSGVLDNCRASEIQKQVEQLRLTPGDAVVMNLQSVEQMNSSGVGLLVLWLKRLRAMGVQFYICHPSPPVQLALKMSGMMRSFPTYDREPSRRKSRRLQLSHRLSSLTRPH